MVILNPLVEDIESCIYNSWHRSFVLLLVLITKTRVRELDDEFPAVRIRYGGPLWYANWKFAAPCALPARFNEGRRLMRLAAALSYPVVALRDQSGGWLRT